VILARRIKNIISEVFYKNSEQYEYNSRPHFLCEEMNPSQSYASSRFLEISGTKDSALP
jgi:hypothetical protein